MHQDSHCPQVIKHLHTKGAEHSCNLPEAAGEYEVEIEQILQTTATRLDAFSKQMALQVEEERIAEVVKVRRQHQQTACLLHYLSTLLPLRRMTCANCHACEVCKTPTSALYGCSNCV